MGVAVVVLRYVKGPSGPFQVDGDVDVYVYVALLVLVVLYVATRKRTGLLGEPAGLVYQGQCSDAVGLTDLHIIRAEARGRMHDSRAGVRSDEVPRNDPKGVSAYGCTSR